MKLLSFLKSLFTKKEQQPTSAIKVEDKSTNVEISFPAQEQVEEFRVIFPAVVNGRRVGCIITGEALQDQFRLRDEDLLGAFIANRNAIEEATSRLIRQNPNHSGPYLLNTQSF